MSEFQAREYQVEAADALFASVQESKENHPVAALPTGSGKSLVMCLLIEKIIDSNPRNKVLVLSHDSRILDQNQKELLEYFGAGIGVYSAGLNSREIKMVTVAGIQSVYRRAKQFDHFNYVIIDEAHMINHEERGMYRKFLSKIPANYIGLTATAFRTGGGFLHEGATALFNDLAYNMANPEGFKTLIDGGYLCPVYSKGTLMKMKAEGMREIAGDYSAKELSKKFDKEPITFACVIETIKFGKNYKRWLCFAIDIQHCENITEMFISEGVSAVAIHSKAEDVDQKIQDYREGKYRVAVNVDMLTTGFNIPEIDLISMMRSTKSLVFHIQSIGRATRVSPGKDHALVLDFGNNTKNLGPIDDPQIVSKEKGKGGGDAIMKECPECNILLYAAVRECFNCGHEFVFEKHIEISADSESSIMSAERVYTKEWINISSIGYDIVQRKGKPSFMRVSYFCGIQTISEPIMINQRGWAGNRARSWINFRLKFTAEHPENLQDLYARREELRTPLSIFVELGGKFPNILDYDFDEKRGPEIIPPSTPSADYWDDDLPF